MAKKLKTKTEEIRKLSAADLAKAPVILPYTERCSQPGEKLSPPHGTVN